MVGVITRGGVHRTGAALIGVGGCPVGSLAVVRSARTLRTTDRVMSPAPDRAVMTAGTFWQTTHMDSSGVDAAIVGLHPLPVAPGAMSRLRANCPHIVA